MLSATWTETDLSIAESAFQRRFPLGRGMSVWTADAVTARDWAGAVKQGLSALDTRIHFKNGAEYHGMEVYAWQYVVTAMYSDASEHFYAAALWRENDASLITASNPTTGVDSGHLNAITQCIRMGRYSSALGEAQRLKRRVPLPHEFELESDFVERGESRARIAFDRLPAELRLSRR